MTLTRVSESDRGQAFPIYIMMVAGLLFLALAFFAVGKASATRNGAQGAADAAALAAALEARREMGPDFLAALMVPHGLEEFFSSARSTGKSCVEAQRFADKNRADLVSNGLDGPCAWSGGVFQDEVTVNVRTRYTVGESVLPGTSERHATASATARVEFLCSWELVANRVGSGKGSGEASASKDEPNLIEFTCEDRDKFTVDPLNPEPWGELAEAFFAIHLID
ncbi:pilus assembly protein TadG-related protein [Streptomyces sp. NPDC127084]|uniref:pilus assembly protein TadG-related protein n=1 Tax=Streptomyces sp. NPDC127084 TaxID=3347133 RepID=UPI003657A9E1